jgi:hypothetical protein
MKGKMKMEIKKLPIGKINPAKYNPRVDLKPGDPEYERIAKAIEEYDLVEPLIWNKQTGNLVGGHQRLKVLIGRGDKEVDVSVVDLPLEKEKTLNIALNKLTGEWDIPKLGELLTELKLDFNVPDIEITGFSIDEVDKIINAVPDFVETDGSDQSDLGEEYEPMSKSSMTCPNCGFKFTPGNQK